MNTIYYANLKTGQRAAVKVAQPSYAVICRIENGAKEIRRNEAKPRPMMAQADEAMHRKGFVRYPRKKPIPGFIEIKRAA